ncbi:unnamed protein product, partial [Iphiclides podalirius]
MNGGCYTTELLGCCTDIFSDLRYFSNLHSPGDTSGRKLKGAQVHLQLIARHLETSSAKRTEAYPLWGRVSPEPAWPGQNTSP